jgi:outer membrane lipoprotein SlyB
VTTGETQEEKARSITGRCFLNLVAFNLQQERSIMKKLNVSILLAMVLQTGIAHADTVIEEVPDTLPGKGVGGLSGFMVGAAAGGPVGALVGAGIGWLGGGETQEASGITGTAYKVKREDGSETIVRSPNRQFAAGDRVQIVANRLIADSAAESMEPVALSHR